MENIQDNISLVKKRISKAALKAGQRVEDIRLVAVSKTITAEAIRNASAGGLTEFGESRIQEAEPKINELGNIGIWHMIGHLQSNKAKRAVALFDLIQSLDSVKLASEINRYSEQLGKKTKCLLEVNSSGEGSKFGVEPEKAQELAGKINGFDNIELCGVMTIGPLVEEEKAIRKAFVQTKELFDNLKGKLGEQFSVLSMGMSSDFEIAIEEGSNMIRVGTAIFGNRTLANNENKH